MNQAVESLEALLASAPAGPPALAAQRAAAAESFRRLGLPTTKDEDWRYTNLGELAKLRLRRAAPAPASAAAIELPPAPRIVFVNGRHDPALSDLQGLPEGALVASLADALQRHGDLVEPWLGRRAQLDLHPFAALNAALAEDGAVVILAEGVEAPRPLHVVHLATRAEGAAIHPRHLVVAAPRSRIALAEIYAGEDGPYLVNAHTEVFVAEGAEVDHTRVQRESGGAFHVGLVEVEQGAASRFRGHSIALGARLARVEARALLAGEKADCTLEGLYVPTGSQHQDHLVLVDHASPGCTSREVFKGVLDERGHGVFAGRIVVRPDAQKTDAAQVNSNLLLSPDAVIDTKPQLQIDADDVKCSHGGTVGQLDENALFYLRSRGVDPATARALLTWAFASEIVEGVASAPLRAEVRRAVAERLGAGAAIEEARA